MKSLKICLTVLFFISGITFSHAQVFLKKNTTDKKLTFVEMQKRFGDWAKITDLKKTKHWKYYKRWENDMQFKANGKGEPGDPSIYINEAVKVANEKNKNVRSKAFSSTGWSPLGPFALPGNETGYMQNGIGRINCIAFHPTDPNTYFVGVAQGGVWKTTNNGVSWIPLTDNLPIIRVSSITIDPNNTNVMYISLCDFEYIDVSLILNGNKRNTHYGLGVYKTTDGGTTWAPTGLSFQLTNGDASLIRKVLVNPANSNQLVACGVSGIYTSSNAGITWTHTLDSLFWDLVQDPINSNILYATTGWLVNANIGSAGIYKSTNFGATWTMLTTNIPATGVVQRIKLAIAPSDNNYIYACAVDNQGGMYGIYKSIDAGVTWQFINSGVNILEAGNGTQPGGQGTYDLGFTVNSTNKNIVYEGGVNIWVSTDGAQTFNPASHWTLAYGPTIHGDIHFIETQGATGNVFVCSDGGLYKTTGITPQTWADANNGSPWPTSWSTISNGLAISSFYRISSSKNTTGRLIAGAQDNASFYYDGTAWNTIFGGDGMDNYLDPVNDNDVIGSSQFGSYYVSQDNGISNISSNPNVNSETAEWTSPIVADYNNYGTLYAGFTNVTKSTDVGVSWNSLNSLPSNGIHDNEISALAVANSNQNIIYATRRIRFEYNSPPGAYRTIDGGLNWTDITSNLPDSLYYTSIDISQTNANTAYVAMAGLTPGVKMYKTINGGTSWQNISFNLPNAPVNCVKTESITGDVWIATDMGIYRFDTNNNTWINESLGLPNVITTDIEFNTSLNKMYVSTFGRGIWEADIPNTVGTGNQQKGDIGIELFPSPNHGSFTLSISPDLINETFKLEVVDITGRLVYSTVLNGQTKYSQTLNVTSGMYYAKIKSKNLNGVKNFIVK